ncbi:MAG: RNA polymerase factor sigma-54 [Verrucomicrobiota bacterium]|nr:RNA polymerase factor sigma-54 [Verrucomicrobiota bacterium]
MSSPSLSLTQSQRLQMVLAPQLRQSLEILQMPILDLRGLIQQEIEQNPTIEEASITAPSVEIEPGVAQGEGAPEQQRTEMDFEKEYEALASLDEEWRDYFFQDAQSNPYTDEQARGRQFFLDSLPQRESLQEHLLGQLSLSGFSDKDIQVGKLVIGSINDDGYLTASTEELALSANCDLQHLTDILSVIQDFHPTGVGARGLGECLLLQLERIGKADTLAAKIVKDHLDRLAAKKFADIARALRNSLEQIQEAAKLIATLEPKPGRAFSIETAAYVFPEVLVRKIEGRWVVILDDDQLPHIRISKQYRDLMADKSTSSEVRSYIRERVRSSAFLIKSIAQRQKTIHRIASEIVAAQIDFLDDGIAHLRPMTMAEVARKVGVHETTVSRAVAGKYMQTTTGIFEMKYFFTPGIKTANGQEISNKTVKDLISQMAANEDKTNPLSDQEIMERLKAQGIEVARRTIAKYRLLLRIPPSHLRKGF